MSSQGRRIFVETAPMPDIISVYHLTQKQINQFVRRPLLWPERNRTSFDYAHNLFHPQTGRMLDVGIDDNSIGVPAFGLFMYRSLLRDRSRATDVHTAYAMGWTSHQLADSAVHGLHGMAERFHYTPPFIPAAITSVRGRIIGHHGAFEACIDAINYDLCCLQMAGGGELRMQFPVIPWLMHDASLEMLRSLSLKERQGFEELTGERMILRMRHAFKWAMYDGAGSAFPGAILLAERLRRSRQYDEIYAFYRGMPLKTYFAYGRKKNVDKPALIYSRLPAELKKALSLKAVKSVAIRPDTYLERYDYRLPYRKGVSRIAGFVKSPKSFASAYKPLPGVKAERLSTELYSAFAMDLTGNAERAGVIRSTMSLEEGSAPAIYRLKIAIADAAAFDTALKATIEDWLGKPSMERRGLAEAAAWADDEDYRIAARYLALVIDGIIYHPEMTYAEVLQRADADLERRVGGGLISPGNIPSGMAPVISFTGMPRPDVLSPVRAFIDGREALPVWLPAIAGIAFQPAAFLPEGRHLLEVTALSEAGESLDYRLFFRTTGKRSFIVKNANYAALLPLSQGAGGMPGLRSGSLVGGVAPAYSIPINLSSLTAQGLSQSGKSADYAAVVFFDHDGMRESLLFSAGLALILMWLTITLMRRRRRM